LLNKPLQDRFAESTKSKVNYPQVKTNNFFTKSLDQNDFRRTLKSEGNVQFFKNSIKLIYKNEIISIQCDIFLSHVLV